MREDYAVAIILIVLISALILGSFSQTGTTITGAAFFTDFAGIQDGEDKTTLWVVLVVSVVVVLIAAFASYKLYLKEALAQRRFKKSLGRGETEFKPDSFSLEPAKLKKSDLDRVIDYVFSQRGKGVPDEEIRTKLEAVGWSPEVIDKALK